MLPMSENPNSELIHEIEAWCARHGVSHRRFGSLAVNDTALMTTLQRGRELRRATEAKVRDLLAGEPPQSDAQAAAE